MTIKVYYRAVDGCSKTAKFKTLKGARKFAHKWVGEHPEMVLAYAVSSDGVGRIMVDGVSLSELFPPTTTHDEDRPDVWYIDEHGTRYY